MSNFIILPIIIAAALVALVTYKTLHFFANIHRKKLRYWLYFDKSNILNSMSVASERSKRIQNQLSLIAMILVVLNIIAFALIQMID